MQHKSTKITNPQIKIISQLINKADKTDDYLDKLSFIKAIDSILKNKEKKSLMLIEKKTENITNQNT